MIIEESVLKTMYDILDNFDVNRSIVPKNLIPTLFLEKLIECSNLFVEKQMCSINRSLYYRYKYYNDYNEQDRISAHRDHVIENWLKIYDIHPINSKDKILKN